MMNLSEVKFIDAANAATISEEFDNYKGNLITIQASGTASAIECKLEGKTNINADWKDLAMIDLTDFSVNTVMNTKNVYQTSIEGITKIRINLTTVTGGSITVFGRVTN